MKTSVKWVESVCISLLQISRSPSSVKPGPTEPQTLRGTPSSSHIALRPLAVLLQPLAFFNLPRTSSFRMFRMHDCVAASRPFDFPYLGPEEEKRIHCLRKNRRERNHHCPSRTHVAPILGHIYIAPKKGPVSACYAQHSHKPKQQRFNTRSLFSYKPGHTHHVAIANALSSRFPDSTYSSNHPSGSSRRIPVQKAVSCCPSSG